MKIFLAILLAYSAFGWVLTVLIRYWADKNPGLREKLEAAEMEAARCWYDRGRAQSAAAYLGPMWVPLALAMTLLGRGPHVVTVWKRGPSRRPFHEYRFTEINYFEQSPELRAAFDEITAAAMGTDFRLVGDYRLKTDPVTVLDRFFWHSDGTTWGSCCWIAELSEKGDRNVAFDTVLSDGTHVTTTTVADPHPDDPPCPKLDRLRVVYAPALPFEEAYQRHVEEVRRIAVEHDAEILQFDASYLEELVVFNQRVFHQYLHRIASSEAPPPPELPPVRGRLTPDEYALTTIEWPGTPACATLPSIPACESVVES